MWLEYMSLRLIHSTKSILEGKMLFYMFLVLGVWKGVIGNDDSCDDTAFRNCDVSGMINFPKTEEDINRMCLTVQQTLDCLKGYSDRCGYHEDLTEEVYRKVKSVVEDICQKDSPLHLGIVQNLDCYNEVVENDYESCGRDSIPRAEKMSKYIRNLEAERGYDEDEYDDELWRPYRCIGQSLQLTCFISKASERCGTNAKNIATEVLTRSSVAHRSCFVSKEEKLAELVALLDLELEEEALLNRFVRKE